MCDSGHPPPKARCALCGASKSSSFRRNIAPRGLVCNACCCFLYRRVRGECGSSSVAQVAALACELLASEDAPDILELRNKRQKRMHADEPTQTEALDHGPAPATMLSPKRMDASQDRQRRRRQPSPPSPLPPQQHMPWQQHGQCLAMSLQDELLAELEHALSHKETEQEDQRQPSQHLASWRALPAEACWQVQRLSEQGSAVRVAELLLPVAKAAAQHPADEQQHEQTREAAWRAAADHEQAAASIMEAWRLSRAAGNASAGLEERLRLLVHSRQGGALLHALDWAAGSPVADRPLQPHPELGLPCWDSGEGWSLLFPDPAIEHHQADLFCGHADPERFVLHLPEQLPLAPPFCEAMDSPRCAQQAQQAQQARCAQPTLTSVSLPLRVLAPEPDALRAAVSSPLSSRLLLPGLPDGADPAARLSASLLQLPSTSVRSTQLSSGSPTAAGQQAQQAQHGAAAPCFDGPDAFSDFWDPSAGGSPLF
ncbi:hypothetical protein ABPG75_013590 [Micractinium tetrahymenae]